MKEIWKSVNDKYSVSNYGNVRHKINKKNLSPVFNKGYKFVCVERRKLHPVHRLVAAAFCEKKDGCNFVDHIDGNKTNCNSSNLEWVTQSENNRRSFKNGQAAIGSRKNQSSLIEKDIIHIRDEANRGIRITDLSKGYSVSTSAISQIVNRKTWTHV